jgi:hypothetical protein
MRITSGGNVGIGTSSPGEKLSIAGAANVYASLLSTGGIKAQLNAADATGAGAIGTVTNHPFRLETNNTERMRIAANGDVGIGTSSPSYRLDVSGNSIIGDGTDRTPSSNWDGQLNVRGNGYTGGISLNATGMWVGHNSNGRALIFAPDETERMRITAGGEVYIAGTTDQGAFNLQVNGTGVWGAGAYVNGSDRRIKDEIAPIASGLDVVAKLRPVQFRYKESWSKDRSLQPGFIAQELQEALADQPYVEGVVHQGPEYMSVSYQTLIPVLTKAVQELTAKLEAAEARIATLEAR